MGANFDTGRRLYQSEKGIAERILRLAAGKPSWPEIDAAKAIDWLATRSSFALADSQKQAVELALCSKVLVITGGPGVGKTTIVNSILRILKAKHVEMLLCAPTGRAAKRMSEATGHEAKTIHRLLEVDPQAGGFRKDQDNPLDTDLLVVDEASMIDVPLMHALVKAVPSHAALLIVGDIDQLPSVGPGQVLADVIASGAVPVVWLTEVFRQAAQSRIVTMAHRINKPTRYWTEKRARLLSNDLKALHGKPVAFIKRGEIAVVIDKVQNRSHAAARLIFADIRPIFAWALDRAAIETNPLTGMKGPQPLGARDRVLSDEEIKAFWQAASELSWPFENVLKVLLLTGQRREEVAGMRWREVDPDAGTWTIAKERCKNGKAHTVDLSPEAARLLDSLGDVAAARLTRNAEQPHGDAGPDRIHRHAQLGKGVMTYGGWYQERRADS